jgi:dienelactone hydrolase
MASTGMVIRLWKLIVGFVLLAGAALVADDRELTPPVRCPYATAHSEPLNAKEEMIESVDAYEKWRVEFSGIKADRVPAFLYLPRTERKKHPAVLLQYGSGGDKRVDYIVAMGRQFTAHGFVVLTIDSPGRGERKTGQTSKRGVEWLSSEGRDVFLQYCGDYSRAVDYLESRPDVDHERLCYVGLSWGAITGVTYVAHDERIKAMGSMVGGGNFLGGASSDAQNGENRERPISIDPVQHVKRIAPRPLLLLNVTRDGAKKVWIETDHYFNDVDRHEIGESVIRFMEENLAR